MKLRNREAGLLKFRVTVGGPDNNLDTCGWFTEAVNAAAAVEAALDSFPEAARAQRLGLHLIATEIGTD